jgi:NAD(P)H-hydrate epimerase
MIKAVTAKQMRDMDRRAIEEMGVPSLVLMENAGLAVARAIREKIPELRGSRVNIFAGKGNNGGDGLVVARHLINAGADVAVFLVATMAEVKGDAKANLDAFTAMGGKVKEFIIERHIKNFKLKFAHTTVVVDALMGTGAVSAPKGFYGRVIEVMNAQGRLKVAVDIPSGILSDSGVVPGVCFKADVTVTFGAPKVGMLIHPARAFVGELTVADISIPAKVLAESPCVAYVPEPRDIRAMLPKRPADAHKGVFGHLLLACGSTGMGGAGVLAALAALRAGTGLVTLAAPSGVAVAYETWALEAIGLPLPQTQSGGIAEEAFDRFINAVEGKTAVLIGPGLGQDPSTGRFIRRAVAHIDKPLVLDADGLNLIKDDAGVLKNRKAPTIITPHPGEMARLVKKTTMQVQSDRLGEALALARETGAVVVLKGAGTVIALADGRAFINPTGNHGLASGGTGDALAGLIGGLLAQGAEPENAAIAGVYIHGMTADIFAAKHGDPRSLIASDIIALLPEAIGR